MKPGDLVRAISEDCHMFEPGYYPEVGTIGVFQEAFDDGTILVRWPEGSTLTPSVWCCLQSAVEFVDE